MNILLINPPNIPYSDTSLLIEPIDLIQLGSFLEYLNHEVVFLDMDLKRMKNNELKEFLLEYKKFDFAIISYDYHIPLHTKSVLYNIKYISEILQNYNIKTVLIGKTVTYNPSIINELNINFGIVGEVEDGLLQLLHGEQNQIIYSKHKINLDNLPIVNRHFVNVEDYIDIRSMLTSRGCINQCSFCPISNYWGGWRGRAPAAVVKEIEYLINTYGTQKIIFLDDNATVDKDRMRKISQIILDRGIKIKLGCLSSINCYDKETFELMYKAGFRWIHFGIESGSEKVLNYNNKFFSINYAKQVIKECKEMGYRIRNSFILDLPGTTREDMYKTIDFILETQPDEIRGHFLTPRLGTVFAEEKIPEFIHSGEPLIENKLYPHDLLLQDINLLSEKLRYENYSIIRNTEDWKNLSKLRNKNNEIKFLAFCPAKYGIDW